MSESSCVWIRSRRMRVIIISMIVRKSKSLLKLSPLFSRKSFDGCIRQFQTIQRRYTCIRVHAYRNCRQITKLFYHSSHASRDEYRLWDSSETWPARIDSGDNSSIPCIIYCRISVVSLNHGKEKIKCYDIISIPKYLSHCFSDFSVSGDCFFFFFLRTIVKFVFHGKRF